MIRLIAGDCRTVLATLPAESVHCVVTSPPYYALRSYLDAEHPDKHREIGSEASPDEYLATMVAVFREVRRVLRRDGTCWVNMGDSYAAHPSGHATGPDGRIRPGKWDDTTADDRTFTNKPFSTVGNGYKPKDLLLMPARLALALQADGWWVRSAIVWAKPNPMPESCTDRPTSAYEMVYLLTRSAKYFYDADAVREEPTGRVEPMRFGREVPPGDAPHSAYHTDGAVGRNLRNVWTIATQAYPNAHFATYPAELASRCIRAGTSERGCCAQCGAPWCRTIERGDLVPTRKNYDRRAYGVVRDNPDPNDQGSSRAANGHRANMAYETTTTGWSPSCTCAASAQVDLATVQCTVLDPFAGAGTTLLVADRLQRDAIGIELSPSYTEMAMARCRADAPLFSEWGPVPEPPEEQRQRDMFQEPLAAD